MALLPPAQRSAEYIQLGRDYLQQGLLPEAEVQIQNALTAEPNSADAHAALAQLREASKNLPEARSEAHISIVMKPNVAAYLVLTRLDIAENQLGAAAQDVAQALQLDPKSAPAIALKLAIQQRGQSVP
jgi:Tfp pilus assembly protein PilF